MISIGNYSPAEIEEESFKDEHWACAAENSQGLTSQQAEHCSRQSRAHETFQHSLQHRGKNKKNTYRRYRQLMEHVRPRKYAEEKRQRIHTVC